MVLVHGYLAGGFVGKDKCITSPSDVDGLQTRAAGKSFEQMLAGANASITSMASSEIYNAMQTGILNAANTSSSSFVSYRIYEQVSCYTPATENVALWFMYQPLLMNKSTFEGLTSEQQEALLAASAKAEAYYLAEAKKQDAASVEVFEKAGVEIAQMTAEDFAEWRALAQETSYKLFVEDVPDGQALLDMALAVENPTAPATAAHLRSPTQSRPSKVRKGKLTWLAKAQLSPRAPGTTCFCAVLRHCPLSPVGVLPP